MKSLVTKEDLDNYKYVADSVRNNTIWDQFVKESMLLDVKNWLGDALLNELMVQNETLPTTFTALNELLLEGGTYVYSDCTYIFQGLKAAIIYYAFARFTNRIPFNYTAVGLVVKESDYSNPASDKVVQRLETEARLTADAIRDEITLYLNRNCSSYPLWKGGCCCGVTERTRTFKVLGD